MGVQAFLLALHTVRLHICGFDGFFCRSSRVGLTHFPAVHQDHAVELRNDAKKGAMPDMRMGYSTGVMRLWLFLLRQDAKLTRLNVQRLRLRSMRSTAPVVSPGGPIVSVTTYGDRLHTVYLALESIAAGSVLPSRLILWVDDARVLQSPPHSLKRLVNRGLEIRLAEDYGPHKKYYPYLLSSGHFEHPLVTADDDVLYSRWWLAGLVQAHNENAAVVNCYRAHVIRLGDGAVRPYRTWTRCESTTPSFFHFATGSSGCIYPAPLLGRLKLAGSDFKQLCPKADDIWLHANALRAGFKVRQILHRPIDFPLLPGTQEKTLSLTNVGLGRNDEQIRNTYTAQDLALLTER
jgi:hypothetical protein